MFLSKQKDKVNLLINIQSSLVRVALVRITTGALPQIFYIHDEDIPFRVNPNTSYLIKVTLKAVKEAVNAVSEELHVKCRNDVTLDKKISEIHFILAAPWIISHTKTINQKFEKKTTIDKGLIKDILNKQREEYISAKDDKLQIVEEKIFDIALNGYTVVDWEGKSAETLRITFTNSVAGSGMIERFKTICTNTLRFHSIDFHSSLLLEYIGIQSVFPHKEDFVLIHAHGELTDIVVIEKKTCMLFCTLPRGSDSVVRSLSHSLGVKEQVADSMLTMYLDEDIEGSKEKKAAKAIDDLTNQWIGDLVKLLKQSNFDSRLPQSVIITARAHEDFFVNSFKREYPMSVIEPFDVDMMRAKVIYSPKVPNLRHLGLYVIALNTIIK